MKLVRSQIDVLWQSRARLQWWVIIAPILILGTIASRSQAIDEQSPSEIPRSNFGKTLIDVDFTDRNFSVVRHPGCTLDRVNRDENGLFLNGRYEFGSEGYRAVISVPELDYSQFSFSVDFLGWDFEHERSRIPGWLRLLFENLEDDPHTTLMMGGTSFRWLGVKVRDGHLVLSLNNNQVKYAYPHAILKPNQWHTVSGSIDLEAGLIRLMLDGEMVATESLPEDFKLNVIGSPAELNDQALAFTDYSNGETFHGYVARLTVLEAVLSEDKLQEWYRSGHEKRSRLPRSPRGDSLDRSRAALMLVMLIFVIVGICYLWWRRRPDIHLEK